MDLFFYLNVLRNIIVTFFQSGVWVVGFFFLLFRTFDNEKLKNISKYIIGVSLTFLFIDAVLGSI